MSATTVESLQARLDALERARFQCPKDVEKVDESMRRARHAVEQSSCYSASWKFVPAPYYTWSLEQRAKCLGANSIQNLCKSLLMENRKAPNVDENSDPTNPRFVMVIVQYAATLDVKKLTNAVRALRTNVKERLDSNQFEWRIASEEDNAEITGYAHNSVTPFGLLKPVTMIIASSIEPNKFFWMGGGHVHLKLGLAFSEFCLALKPVVADISTPRSALDLAEGGVEEE